MAIGLNEALVLATLEAAPDQAISDIAKRLRTADVSRIDDGSIYMALRRMTDRGMVTQRRMKAVSSDGRTREIGLYTITGQGASAVSEFQRDASQISRILIREGA